MARPTPGLERKDCALALRFRKLGSGWDATLRRILVDSLGKVLREPRKNLFAGQAGQLGQVLQDVWPDCALQLRRSNLFVRPTSDPRVCHVTVTFLCKGVDKITKPTTQQIADTLSAERATQVSG